jgi:tripartite-type tricarboxylate transporter receptor subunit TctC
MSLDKALKNLKFDVRMTESNINNNTISKEELKAHLEKLPDSASNGEQINLEENKSSAQHH